MFKNDVLTLDGQEGEALLNIAAVGVHRHMVR